ncbi:MAG: ubiquinol-cytochrome C chaperone family protein [Pseudomonadota bacterium]
MIFSLFKKDRQRDAARSLYINAMEQSRLPVFYTAYAVPDTFDARFDLLTVHVYTLMRALKTSGGQGDKAAQSRDLSQKLFEVMFRNLDDTLREMGVGDLSVAKKIRPMAEAFYGRVGAYETAFGASGLRGGDLRADAPDEVPGAAEMTEGTGDRAASADGVPAQSPPQSARQSLALALLRNVYGLGDAVETPAAIAPDLMAKAEALADHLIACNDSLSCQPLSRLLSGIITFPEPAGVREPA